MKKILAFLILCQINFVYAQNAAINSDGSAAHSSAILDVKATDKGVLFPRMTKAQRDAIPSPTAGLMIYQTDNVEGMRIYNATMGKWLLQTPVRATIQEVKAAGVASSTPHSCAAGSICWDQAALNTISDPHGIVSAFASSRFTLPAGRYTIDAICDAKGSTTKIVLWDVTNSSVILVGTSVTGRHIYLNSSFGLSASSVFELRVLGSLGSQLDTTSGGHTVIYTDITLTKLE